MSQRFSYSYSILRYVHDISTGEFVNVGLVMHARNSSFFRFKNKTTTGRISALFPNFKPSRFKGLMRLVRDRFGVLEKECGSDLALWKSAESLTEILSRAVPKDDSSLIWSDVSTGISEDLDATFDKIFARYVTQFDHRILNHGRSDDDIWRSFKRDLERRNLLHFFEPKKISGKDDEIEFPLAWKNGIWHCVEPVSFDLGRPDSIRDKAHKFLGQLTSVADSNEAFKLYIVAGKPRDTSLLDAFTKAMHILEKIPGAKEIYTDEQSAQLADRFSAQIPARLNPQQQLIDDRT